MNTTDTTVISTNNLPDCQFNNIWIPLIIQLQTLGLGGNYLKYYLGNKKQVTLLDFIRSLVSGPTNLQSEQVQLNILKHLKASVAKDTKDT